MQKIIGRVYYLDPHLSKTYLMCADGEHGGRLTVNEEANSVDYTREGNEVRIQQTKD